MFPSDILPDNSHDFFKSLLKCHLLEEFYANHPSPDIFILFYFSSFFSTYHLLTYYLILSFIIAFFIVFYSLPSSSSAN